MRTCSEPEAVQIPAQLYLQFTELLHSLTQSCNLQGIKEHIEGSDPDVAPLHVRQTAEAAAAREKCDFSLYRSFCDVQEF